MSVRILVGDCRSKLKELADNSVHCCISSPPYFGLRDYGVDGQIGLEPTPDAYVAEMVEVFREVRRVLRSDGTCWLNLGDSYASSTKGTGGGSSKSGLMRDGRPESGRASKVAAVARQQHAPIIFDCGLAQKQLIGIPWRVAFALQADGWWLRQDIIWCLSGGTWLYARTASGVGPAMLKDLARLKPETVELWTGERWTKVTAWTKRSGRADAVELVLRSGERVGCTSNHVWPTERGNLRTDELNAGDVITTARLPDADMPTGWLTDDAFWFAGLFLAEGSRSGETIQISGHAKEVSRLSRIRSLIAHYGGSARAYVKGNNQSIHIDSIAVGAILRQIIAGRTAKDKRLASSTWRYPNWQLSKLAEGYLEGDGAIDGDRIRLGFCRNYSLERDLRCLAARLGATLTLKPSISRNQTGSFPSFRGEWRWSRSGYHTERDRGEIIEIRRSRARKFWDVTVADEPHLFALASGVLTHNSKPNPMPESVTDRCTKAHEYLFLLSKSARYYFDAAAIAEPAETFERQNTHGLSPKNSVKQGLGYFSGKTGLVDPYAYATRNRRSVWTVATQPFSEAHFATFPPALIEPCIKAGCPVGGTVLDPFGGAGTTALVADRLQRNAILIELNESYALMSKRRLETDGGMLSRVDLVLPARTLSPLPAERTAERFRDDLAPLQPLAVGGASV